jgi:hypothetical protein
MMTFGRRHHDAMGTLLCDRCGRPTRAWCTSLSDDAAICRACSLIVARTATAPAPGPPTRRLSALATTTTPVPGRRRT